MTLFHGSDKSVITPTIPISEIGREFGIGFYTYPTREPAEEQAFRKVKQAFFLDHPHPTVSCYRFDLDTARQELKVIELPCFDAQWLEFIMRCYTDIHFVHRYDIVVGNMVTAEAGGLLTAYRQKQITQTVLLQELQSVPAVTQICFSTARSLELLKYIE